MPKPIYTWTLFARLGLRWKKARRRTGIRHRSLRLEGLQSREMLATDLAVTGFAADGANLVATYNVHNEAAAVFRVGVYRSADGTTAEALLASQRVSDPTGLAVGSGHTVSIPAGFQDSEEDYFLVVRLDDAEEVQEADEANNGRLFDGGVFVDAAGMVQVHGTAAADTVHVGFSTGIDVRLEQDTYQYDPASVWGIHVRTHAGNDHVTAAAGVPTVIWAFAGNGNDVIHGGAGSDRLYGGLGDDQLLGRSGNDRLYGDPSDDNQGNDSLDGGEDMDILFGHGGNDTLIGGTEIDTLFGGGDDDTLSGNEGDDALYGQDGEDVLYGGDGNDLLFGDGEDALIDGGEGENLVDRSYPDARPYEGLNLPDGEPVADAPGHNRGVSGHGRGNLPIGGGVFSLTSAQQATPGVTEWIVDNSSTPGYTETGGGWYTSTWHLPDKPAPYGGNNRLRGPATAGADATWALTGLESATYQILATWVVSSSFLDGACYEILDDETPRGTVAVNQKLSPNGTGDDAGWESLGFVTVTSGTVGVRLSAADYWWCATCSLV